MLRNYLTAVMFSALCASLLALSACSPLPKDWPIKELTLPPQTAVAAMPERARLLREKINILPQIGDRIPLMPTYAVAFSTSSTTVKWETLVSSVSGQLKPLGYTEWRPANMTEANNVVATIGESHDFDNAVRVWESKDKLLVVNLINCMGLVVTGESIDRPGDYILCVNKRSAPPPN